MDANLNNLSKAKRMTAVDYMVSIVPALLFGLFIDDGADFWMIGAVGVYVLFIAIGGCGGSLTTVYAKLTQSMKLQKPVAEYARFVGVGVLYYLLWCGFMVMFSLLV